jgi:RHS repeat-associated protein
VTADIHYVWADEQVVEERSILNGTVRRFFEHGFSGPLGDRFYAKDQSGSVRQTTNSSQAVVAAFEYSPYGVPQRVLGTEDSPVGFHGYLAFGTMWVTKYRAYDPGLGVWLSADPARWLVSPNHSAFVDGDPVNSVDVDGLQSQPCATTASRELVRGPSIRGRKEPGNWEFSSATSEYSTPPGKIDSLPGTVAICMWKRFVKQPYSFRVIYLDTITCKQCNRTWSFWRFRSERWEGVDFFWEYRPTKSWIPILVDMFVSPEQQCRRGGPPGPVW